MHIAVFVVTVTVLVSTQSAARSSVLSRGGPTRSASDARASTIMLGGASRFVRARAVDTPGGRLLDAFVRSPRSPVPNQESASAHVIMIGGGLGLAVTCLPEPQSGIVLVCRFASEDVPVRAFGLTRMAARHPNCYSVLACRVPLRDYASAAARPVGHLEVELTTNGSSLETRYNWSGFSTQLRLPLAPYAARQHAAPGDPAGSHIALTAMVKNAVRSERPHRVAHGAELLEWLEYHRLLGVGRFYLYDNGSTDRTKALLQSYAAAGVVTAVSWPFQLGGRSNNRAQGPQINHALFAFAHHAAWLGFIDTDEFLSIPSPRMLPTTWIDETATACEDGLKLLWMGNRLRDTASCTAASTAGEARRFAPRVGHCRRQHREVRSPPKVIISVGRANALPTAAFRSVHHFELWKADAVRNPCMHPTREADLVIKHFAAKCDCSSPFDPERLDLGGVVRAKSSGAASSSSVDSDAGAYCEVDDALDEISGPLAVRMRALAACARRPIGSSAGGGSDNDAAVALPEASCIRESSSSAAPSMNASASLRAHFARLFARTPLEPPPYDITNVQPPSAPPRMRG